MGLEPRVFWSLNNHEFWIKHRAFIRAESRARALAFELGSLIKPPATKNDAKQRQQAITSLRRYPVKQWLDRPK